MRNGFFILFVLLMIPGCSLSSKFVITKNNWDNKPLKGLETRAELTINY